MLYRLRLVAAAMLVLMSAVIGRADIVHLTDGSKVEGVILEETGTYLRLDTMLADRRIKRTIAMNQVVKIERKPVAADFFEGAPAPAIERPDVDVPGSSRPSSAESEDLPKYFVVPMHGTFGVDIQAEGVEEILKRGKRQYTHIIFDFDSPGGYLNASYWIAEQMEEYGETYTFAAVISKEALSASVWVLAMCDHIFIRPGATTGAAVAFTQDVESGAAEVDAKFISAIVADISSMAEVRKHNPLIFRAMIELEAELYAVSNGDGTYRLTGTKPEGDDVRFETLCTSEEILTLTHDQAVKYGFAKSFTEGIETLAEALGVEAWEDDRGLGKRIMDTHKRKYERDVEVLLGRQKEIELEARRLEHKWDELFRATPSAASYPIDRNGQFTNAGRQQWIRNCDRATAAARSVLKSFETINKAIEEYERRNFEHGMDKEAIKEVGDRVEAYIRWLRKARRSTQVEIFV